MTSGRASESKKRTVRSLLTEMTGQQWMVLLLLGMLLTVIALPVSDSKEQTEEKDKKKESTDTSENTETEDVDYDLTEMNSDMVYATVYQMMMEPEQYEGKTIRIDGNYYISKDEATGNTYHFCVIKDALACCAQGLEFVRKNEEELSDEDYPEQETEIIVQGTFETYKEPNDETLYCRITDADMQIKK